MSQSRQIRKYWPLAAVALIALLHVRSDVALLLGLTAAFFVKGHQAWLDGPTLKRWQTNLLQLCVVGLGFGIELQSVLETGRDQFLVTLVSISSTLALGMLLGRLCALSTKGSYLIAAGTAICGGSAIAALSPIIKPKPEELALSLAIIFLLNSVALLTFPLLGHLTHLSGSEFGLWAALAIHDTSSVVGAAQHFGEGSLLIATTVKLMRALWILPMAIATAWFVAHRARDKGLTAKPKFPWFILGFVCATAFTTSFMQTIPGPIADVSSLARRLLAGVLFLIGLQLPIKSLKGTGARTLAAATALWLVVSTVSFLFVTR